MEGRVNVTRPLAYRRQSESRYDIKQRGPSGAVLLSGAPDLTLEVRPSPSAFGKLQDLQAVSGRRSYGDQAIAADWRASRGDRLS